MRRLRFWAAMTVVATSYLAAATSVSLALSDIVVRSKENKAYDCRGGALTVEGGFNVLTLRNCTRLSVDGGENTIDAGVVDEIEVSGAGNKITWAETPDGRRPRITNEGEGNVIVSRRAAAGDVARSSAPSGPAPSGTAPSRPAGSSQVSVSGHQVKLQDPDGSITVGADGSVTLKDGSPGSAAQGAGAAGKVRFDKDGLKEVYDCRGAGALVNGDRNDLTLRNCNQISVNGNANVLAVRAAQSVLINGDDNKLTWEPADDGSRPRITDNGKGNTVTSKR